MSQQIVIGALNRLLEHQCYSLVNYLSEAPPWTHPGNEELVEATRNVVADHEHYAQQLADAIEDRGGIVNLGRFPMRFLSLSDLALDYLLARMIENQQRNIETNEQCVADLSEDPLACRLAADVLESERTHLDIMMEFLPHTEPVLNGDEIRSLSA